MADASVHFLPAGFSKEQLKALTTINGGEDVGLPDPAPRTYSAAPLVAQPRRAGILHGVARRPDVASYPPAAQRRCCTPHSASERSESSS